MRHFFAALVCAGLTLHAHAREVAPIVPDTLAGGYCLVWHDEFSHDGRPAAADWDFEQGYVRNKEWQWYQADNAEVRDGVLVITARREDRANPLRPEETSPVGKRVGTSEAVTPQPSQSGTKSPTPRDWRSERERIECTSACVITKDRHAFRFGRLLVCARIPASRGTWPAIWLLGSKRDYGWPSCGEVDMMEFYPRGSHAQLHANACWGNDQGGSVWDSQAVPFSHFTSRDSLWATQFHLWRMDWDEHRIQLYLDDELLNEIDLTRTRNGAHGHGDNPFHAPMYLLLNLAMGSTGGPVDEASLPARFEVDYVRLYQRPRPAGDKLEPLHLTGYYDR